MKTVMSVVSAVYGKKSHRNATILAKLVLILVVLLFLYSAAFRQLMMYEGREHSWVTAIYWCLVTMSTLGFGDIVFSSEAGKIFTLVVLLSGTVFMLILLPFTFIQFFFVPWIEAQARARAPRQLPSSTNGHIIFTTLSAIEASLIRRLEQFKVPYVILVSDLEEAISLSDLGYAVMLGDLDDPETYRRAQVEKAILVASTQSDTINTNVAFTVREASALVPIVCTASYEASIDILSLAGSNRVIHLGQLLGQTLARRVIGRDGSAHVVGEFGDLLIAEAVPVDQKLVGKTLAEVGIRAYANVVVIGVWQRGSYQMAGPSTLIDTSSVLIIAGVKQELERYNATFASAVTAESFVVVIGGGRVGRAVADSLETKGIGYQIIERQAERIRDTKNYIHGDAAEFEVLQKAGLDKATTVVVTTHDDDINVYLTIYCRRLRPNIQILGRVTLERNISTLHRAGADFVLSYASLGANALFNLLNRMDTLLLAEGLSVFRIATPKSLAGLTLIESRLRERTGCNLIAIETKSGFLSNPEPQTRIPADGQLILAADAESEAQFLLEYSFGKLRGLRGKTSIVDITKMRNTPSTK